jgi:hypothetical protein
VRYPTTVLSYSPGGGVGTVDAAMVVLGAPDDQRVPLGDDGRLVVLFSSTPVVNGVGDDVRIYGTFATGAQVLVEVSEDGLEWHYSGYIGPQRQTVDLDDSGLGYATYVRLTDTGGGGAAVDALENLQVSLGR